MIIIPTLKGRGTHRLPCHQAGTATHRPSQAIAPNGAPLRGKLAWPPTDMTDVFFFDTEGNDQYITAGRGHAYGWNNYDQNNPPIIGTYPTIFSDQICLFGDLAGKDTYTIENLQTGKDSVDLRMSDGMEVFWPTEAVRDTLSLKSFYGLGVDFKDWQGPEIEAFRDKMAKRFREFK